MVPRDVPAFHDRDSYRYYYPTRKSVQRLGESDGQTGNHFLVDEVVEAETEELEIGGHQVPVWSVGCSQLMTRPAATRGV